MGFPRNYLGTGGGAITTSFDFTDIFEGTAYNVYYGGKASGAYFVSPNTFYSDPKETNYAYSASGSYFAHMDHDFDIEIGNPRIIDGECIANIPVGITETGGSNNVAYKTKMVVIKYDGSTETELATLESVEDACTKSSTNSHMFCVKGDLPRTKFTVGDILRFSVQVWLKSDGANSTGTAYLGHDPMSRASTNIAATDHDETQLIIKIPVKIDL